MTTHVAVVQRTSATLIALTMAAVLVVLEMAIFVNPANAAVVPTVPPTVQLETPADDALPGTTQSTTATEPVNTTTTVSAGSSTSAPKPPSTQTSGAPETGTATSTQADSAATTADESPPTVSQAAVAPARLATAGDFAILAGSTITNTGLTTIEGDVGLHPGSSVTGFAPCAPPAPADCVALTGELHVADGVALQAKNDMLNAYNGLVALETSCTSVNVELAGNTYLPGVYCSPGTFGLSAGGTVRLDARGDPDAQFIFLTGAGGSTLTTGAGSQVLLVGGAQACNVYWQVASSATIGVGTAFAGNILAEQSIQLQTGAVLEGRALAQNAAVTLDTNRITKADCQTVSSQPSTGGGGGEGGQGGSGTTPVGGVTAPAGTPIGLTTGGPGGPAFTTGGRGVPAITTGGPGGPGVPAITTGGPGVPRVVGSPQTGTAPLQRGSSLWLAFVCLSLSVGILTAGAVLSWRRSFAGTALAER